MATLATNSHLSDDDRTKVEERKDALEAEVKRRGGTLAPGWVVDASARTMGVNAGRLDMFYISPEGRRFRSQNEVFVHLELSRPDSVEGGGGGGGGGKRASADTAAYDGRTARGAKLQAMAGIAASTSPQLLKRGRDSPAPQAAVNNGAAAAAAKRFHSTAANIRTSSVQWKAWAFPLSDEAAKAKDDAARAGRRERRARSRQAASYGVYDFALRIDGWMSKVSRYKEGAAVSMEQVLDYLNEGFKPLIDAMNVELTRLGAPAATVEPMAASAAEFISRARDLAREALFKELQATTAHNQLANEIRRVIDEVKEAATRSYEPPMTDAFGSGLASGGAGAFSGRNSPRLPARSARGPATTVAAAAAAAATQRSGLSRPPMQEAGVAAARQALGLQSVSTLRPVAGVGAAGAPQGSSAAEGAAAVEQPAAAAAPAAPAAAPAAPAAQVSTAASRTREALERLGEPPAVATVAPVASVAPPQDAPLTEEQEAQTQGTVAKRAVRAVLEVSKRSLATASDSESGGGTGAEGGGEEVAGGAAPAQPQAVPVDTAGPSDERMAE